MAQDDSISTDAPMQQSASDEDMREDMRLGMSLNDIHMSISRAFHTMNNTTRPCARSLGLGQGQPRILSYIAVHGVSTARNRPLLLHRSLGCVAPARSAGARGLLDERSGP